MDLVNASHMYTCKYRTFFRIDISCKVHHTQAINETILQVESPYLSALNHILMFG